MKIRQGFVSNSSTSSYIVAGIRFSDLDELKEAMLPEKLAELNDKVKEHNNDPKYGYETDIDEWITEMCTQYPYGDDLVFGDYIDSIDYVENLGSIEKFQASVDSAKADVKEWFGEEKVKDVSIWGIKAEC